MRNQWRLLLLRSHLHISTHFSHLQVHRYHNFRFFYSLLHSHTAQISPPPFNSQMQNPNFCPLSFSELTLERKDSDQVFFLTDVFSNPTITNDVIKLELESNNIVITHDLVLRVLRNLHSAPVVASRFFDWVSMVESERLGSKSYNLMLGILGINGMLLESRNMVVDMNKKGYGVSIPTYIKVSENFEKEGLDDNLEGLKELYVFASYYNSREIEDVCSGICKVIQEEIWGDSVEKKLRELNVAFSSDLVVMVVGNLEMEPNKVLRFFRWIGESGLFKHDERTYNAMARVLGRKDCIEMFRRVVDEMRIAGYEMEKGTYVKVLGRFIKRKLVKDAVDLYEFAMGGVNKPSVQECTFLLRKILVRKKIDMDLFSRVVRIYKESGNVLTDSTLDAALKSLTSVGRFGECNKILKAMKEGGFLFSGTLQSKIAFQLSSDGKKDKVREFIDTMEASGCSPNYKTWGALIEGYSVAGHLHEASNCFKEMVQKVGGSCAGYCLELLVTAYCHKNKAMDAAKLLSDMVNEKELNPWHSTYNVLISKLLGQGFFKEALELLGLMKNPGYPPFLDPFIEYVSKTGTADDSIMFLKVVTVMRLPSTPVYLRVFEAYFKAGRHNEAQDFLSKCPLYIRIHADVMNLFFPMKSYGEAADIIPVAA